MILYRNGKFIRQFGETIAEMTNEHRAGCESLRSECEKLEKVALGAENSGLFCYTGVQVETWWDREDRYSAKLLVEYIAPRSAWTHVLDLSASHESPAHWAASEPEFAKLEVLRFAKDADDDAVGAEWEMSASIKGAKSYH